MCQSQVWGRFPLRHRQHANHQEAAAAHWEHRVKEVMAEGGRAASGQRGVQVRPSDWSQQGDRCLAATGATSVLNIVCLFRLFTC